MQGYSSGKWSETTTYRNGLVAIVASESTILIADDQLTNQRKLSPDYQYQGNVAEAGDNGTLALEMLRLSAGNDLILPDILMPGMDDHQMLSRMTADVTLRNIPVIVTPVLKEMDSLVASIERGTEYYLTKVKLTVYRSSLANL